jgi:hypothetical protein
MPEAGDQPAKPLRTWRSKIFWTAGILLALGLAWFVGVVAVPVWQVRSFVKGMPDPANMNALPHPSSPARIARGVGIYLWLPESWAPNKEWAALLYGRCGERATPGLLAALDHRDERVRLVAIMQLGYLADLHRLGNKSPEVALALIKGLGDGNLVGRWGSAESLAKIGPEARCAQAALRKLLQDEVEYVRFRAAVALATIMGPEAMDVGPMLAGDVRSAYRSAGDRCRAILALGCIGAAARDAVPDIEKGLKDEDEKVRSAAAEALKKIHGEEAGPGRRLPAGGL